jgi:hypothetical protein
MKLRRNKSSSPEGATLSRPTPRLARRARARVVAAAARLSTEESGGLPGTAAPALRARGRSVCTAAPAAPAAAAAQLVAAAAGSSSDTCRE